MFQAIESPMHRAKILIVDDRPDNLELLSTICTLQGYEVAKSDRGDLAIELAKKERPDLILLDISLPGMDGFRVCQILKNNSKTRDIPIIFISALQEVENKTQAFELGGNDYITKPFQIQEVIARVETQLKSYYLQTELKAKNQQLAKEIKHRRVVEAKLLKLNEKLGQLATSDGLTAIANRHHFEQIFTKEWQRGKREHSWLGLILCDIDYFKLYNDSFGHQAGDSCLKQVAQAISQTVNRPGDLAARYGGEEFVVILPKTIGKNALFVAEKIRQQVKKLKISHPNSLVSDYVSLSLGVSSIIPNPATTQEKLLVTADKALYQAKDCGRDRSVFKLIE